MSDQAYAVLNQTIIMFIIVIIGALCYKFRLLNDEGRKQLSSLVLYVVNPLLIFLSYQTELRTELIEGFLWTAFMGALTYAVFIIAANLIFRDKKRSGTVIERFSIIYSNFGFMGTPLIFGVFGSDGVFIQTGFVTVSNLFIWTHGIMSISGDHNRKTALKALCSPALIAVAAGLICFFAQIKLPGMLNTALNNVAEMTTPLAMIVAGASIMSAGLVKSITNPRVYLVSALKLIAMPIIGAAIILFMPCADIPKLITLIEISCPAAAIGTMFAIKYDRDPDLAAQIFAVSTLLSALTLPLMVMAGTTILGVINPK